MFCTLPEGGGTEGKVFCTLPQGRATEPQGVETEPRRRGKAARAAIRTARLAAAAAKHRDLHPDLFHQNLTQDASGEPEQLLDVE